MTNERKRAVAVQLAPRAHVTDEMQNVIMRAFDGAGLEVTEWLPLAGEAQVSQETPRVGEPTLLVVVRGSAELSAEDECTSLAPSIALALSRIRTDLPGLPIGVKVLATEGSGWFGFRREDSADVVARGATMLTDRPRTPGAYGWDDARRAWIPI